MKRDAVSRLILLVLSAMLLAGCTISRDYGPYKGMVLDLETGKPIEGAVVFLTFFTMFQLSPGGPVSKNADAIETVTDRNGEFIIPRHKIKQFRILHGWEPECTAIIFKPGYGAFPRHKKTKPRFDPSYSIPEDQYIVVWLPKLKTLEESRENLFNVGGNFMDDVSIEKQRITLEMYNAERQFFGFSPVLTRKLKQR
ncbi:carboxypeptidase regulatory-like domain-containing protein [Candidatus Parcubacteria bacterium]|nr:MAG: carboxypeptidase regulatory-like domain-containing protein [Candidatus Parcubacteria bacterium]